MKMTIFKYIFIIVLSLSGIYANPNGKNIFNSKGCAACHQPNSDVVGPSLKQIASVYKGNLGELIKFLKGEGSPKLSTGKFAGQYETIMKPQLNQIKSLTPKELKDLAEFILSN